MAIFGQNEDLYYLKTHSDDSDKQPIVLSRIQNWLSGEGTTTHAVIKTSGGTLEKARHANGLTYHRKQGESTGLFFIATRNALQNDSSVADKYKGPQVLAVTRTGTVMKKIYYTHVINSIAYFDTYDGYERFLIGISAVKTTNPDTIIYKYHLVKLVGNTFYPLVQYNTPVISGYRFGNDIYYKSGKLYVTVFKKGVDDNNNAYVFRNKIMPFDISSLPTYDDRVSEDDPPIVTIPSTERRDLIDDKYASEQSYEIEGMSIHSNGKKYVCTNRTNGSSNYAGDWVCKLYAEE
jgi:hypothetical protein